MRLVPDRAGQPELLVLQSVRLTGVADRDAIVDRAFVADAVLDRTLSRAEAAGHIERFTFGDSSGWIITESGSLRLATLLRAEAARGDAGRVLGATLDAFDPLNDRFVGTVSRWQLQSTSAATTGFGTSGTDDVAALLSSLSSMGGELRQVLAPLIVTLPRFGRYPAQFQAAIERARDDGLRWVTGVGLLSCHVLWAELHQDLLSSLGRDRHRDAGW